MNDEFKELYNMLSLDREEVREIKSEYEEDFAMLLGKIRSYHINNVDITSEYDLENEFDTFKVNDTFLRYSINNDAIDYKIAILESYLQELMVDKRFNEYKRKQEEFLNKNEYMEYLNNPSVRSDKVANWYQEFLQK